MTLRNLYVLMLCSSFSCIGYCALEFYEDGEIVAGDDYATVRVFDDATVDMTGGDIGWVNSYGTSVVNIYGGEVYAFSVKDSSVLHLYGGQIEIGVQTWDDTASIYVHGNNFSVYNDNDGILHIMGDWLAGTQFDFPIRSGATELPPQFHLVPEPASIAFLGLGFLAIRKGTIS